MFDDYIKFWFEMTLIHLIRETLCTPNAIPTKLNTDKCTCYEVTMYSNDLKFLDRQVWANSVDTVQTAPERIV